MKHPTLGVEARTLELEWPTEWVHPHPTIPHPGITSWRNGLHPFFRVCVCVCARTTRGLGIQVDLITLQHEALLLGPDGITHRLRAIKRAARGPLGFARGLVQRALLPLSCGESTPPALWGP